MDHLLFEDKIPNNFEGKNINNDLNTQLDYTNNTNQLIKSLLNVQEPENKQFRYFYPIVITINACLSSFFVGYNLGVFNTMQDNLVVAFKWTDENKDFFISTISSSVLWGAILGSTTSGPVLRIVGRRNSDFIYNFLSTIGVSISVIFNEYVIICGRLIVGISIGGYLSLNPIYINEYVPYEISGACGVSIEMMISFGVFMSYVLGFGLPNPDNQVVENRYWSFMFLFLICMIVINQMILIFYLKKDTPKYLVLKSNKEAAFTLMKEIYIDESYIKYLIENIEALEESKTDGSITFRQLLSKSFRKRFFIGILANWGQQSSGVDIIIFYSNKIFNNNISVKLSTILTNILGFMLFFSNILTIFFIEKFGRRKILIFGNLMTLMCLVFVCIFYYLEVFIPIVFLFVILAFINGLAVCPVSYLYSSDVLPDSGMGIANMFNIVSALITVQIFPFLIKSFLKIEGSLMIFVITNFFMLMMIIIFFKETKDKSPKEIEALFS